MKRTLFYAAIAVSLVSSCAKSTDNNENAPEAAPISFENVSVGGTTKALEKSNTWSDGEFIGILGRSATDAEGAIGYTFMANKEVTYSEGVWSYEGTEEPWPSLASEKKIDFFAYHPWSETVKASVATGVGTSIPTATVVGGNSTIKLTHRTENLPNAQTDLLWDLVEDATITHANGGTDDPSNGSTILKMNHALSKVSFLAKTAAKYTGKVVEITGIKVKALQKGELTVLSGNKATGTLPIWTPDEASAYEFVVAGTSQPMTLTDKAVPYIAQGATAANFEMLMIPNSYQKVITVNYTIDNAAQTAIVKTFANEVTNWEQNKWYRYTISIGLNVITFGVEVTGWDSDLIPEIPI